MIYKWDCIQGCSNHNLKMLTEFEHLDKMLFFYIHYFWNHKTSFLIWTVDTFKIFESLTSSPLDTIASRLRMGRLVLVWLKTYKWSSVSHVTCARRHMCKNVWFVDFSHMRSKIYFFISYCIILNLNIENLDVFQISKM